MNLSAESPENNVEPPPTNKIKSNLSIIDGNEFSINLIKSIRYYFLNSEISAE